MTDKRPLRLSLFLSFLKIGAFTFGGGYAMIPLIRREAVEERGWITDDDLLQIIAIAESTPGPIAINAATFVGFRTAGFFGAFFATLGVVLPSFVIISVLSYLLDAFQSVKAVQYAFFGIRAGVLALLFKALFLMFRKCPKKAFSYAVMALSFIAVAVFDVGVLYVILACAAAGLLYAALIGRKAS